jgi:hypothetical protein
MTAGEIKNMCKTSGGCEKCDGADDGKCMFIRRFPWDWELGKEVREQKETVNEQAEEFSLKEAMDAQFILDGFGNGFNIVWRTKGDNELHISGSHGKAAIMDRTMFPHIAPGEAYELKKIAGAFGRALKGLEHKVEDGKLVVMLE